MIHRYFCILFLGFLLFVSPYSYAKFQLAKDGQHFFSTMNSTLILGTRPDPKIFSDLWDKERKRLLRVPVTTFKHLGFTEGTKIQTISEFGEYAAYLLKKEIYVFLGHSENEDGSYWNQLNIVLKDDAKTLSELEKNSEHRITSNGFAYVGSLRKLKAGILREPNFKSLKPTDNLYKDLFSKTNVKYKSAKVASIGLGNIVIVESLDGFETSLHSVKQIETIRSYKDTLKFGEWINGVEIVDALDWRHGDSCHTLYLFSKSASEKVPLPCYE